MFTEITKRNGDVVPFNQNKITIAVRKAFVGENTPVTDDVLEQITNRVLAKLVLTCKQIEGVCPTVEQVQDLVEETLMERGYFRVAKHYILYRFEHNKQRKEKVIEEIEENQLMIKTSKGEEKFSSDRVRAYVTRFTKGFKNFKKDVDEIVNQVEREVYEGITTDELTKLVTMVLRSKIEIDPAYSYISARQLCDRIYSDVIGEVRDLTSVEFTKTYRGAFADTIKTGVEAGKLDERMLDFKLDKLAAGIKPKRDQLFHYLGVETLNDRYFIRTAEGKLLETPQFMWMRVAMGLSLNETDKEAKALSFYNVMSSLDFIPSTPTLFHAGTVHPQLSSCYLNVVEDDLNHIFKVFGDNAQLSKWAGGIGTAWSKLRGTGAAIKKTGITSQGTVPFLKIANDVTVAINRSGRRRGATCVYMENWHYDFEDFLELRKNTGDERRRTHDMNTAAWISDLFMKRVKEDGQWTLFSPDETPELTETYGRRFEALYEQYEEMANQGKLKLFKRLKARDLWKKHLGLLFETGHPWITFKDPSNLRSPQDHAGVVHNSNLCTEITLNTSETETAVCNLGSVNFSRHIKDGKFDEDKVVATTTVAMRMLDNVIDLNFYPTKEAKYSNMKHRPVGLGIMGFQNALYELDINFESDECVAFADRSMEVVSHAAILASTELAKERGAYESFAGSKWDRGLLPHDTVKIVEEERGLSTDTPTEQTRDWATVRAAIAKYGMRNSTCMAIAPTATISNIAGSVPSIEPIYKNIYVKANISGDFIIVNESLVNDLKDRGLWNQEMLYEIKYHDGSVADISTMPDDLKAKYKETFEIDMKWLVKTARVRGRWIDQSQSLNIFYKGISGQEISDLYLYAWEAGLKTTYYLRTLSATQVEKSTIDAKGTQLRNKPSGGKITNDDDVVSDPTNTSNRPVKSPIATPSPITGEALSRSKVMSKQKKNKIKLHVATEEICDACQ